LSGYDIAQVCLNGHVTNDSYRNFPQRNKKFCDKCGEPTITKCPKCETAIRGKYHARGVSSIGFTYHPPAFCHECGQPYPWTTSKIEAAKKMAMELEDISKEDREILAKSFDDMIRDSPEATLAATRFKRIISKVGKPVMEEFRELIVDIASETAKKIIMQEHT